MYVRLITKKEKIMNIEITSGERIMLLVAIEESVRLMKTNPANFDQGLIDLSLSGLNNLYKKVEEVA